MLSPKMLRGLNFQINREIYSAYFYLAMASYAKSIGLFGVSNWFRVQVQEELAHADKLYDFVFENGSRVMLESIEIPPQEFNSARDLFERTLEHEKKVTKLIDDLVQTARSEKDEDTEKFLQWFVAEQVEEEANASNVLGKVKDAGEDPEKMRVLDGELADRSFS